MEQDNAEKEKFVDGNKYLISSQDLKLKDEDITKWSDYDKIETLSKLINETKKKLSNLNLTMEVSLPNSISFEKGLMFLLKKKQKKLPIDV